MIRGLEHLFCEVKAMRIGVVQPRVEKLLARTSCSLSIYKEGL